MAFTKTFQYLSFDRTTAILYVRIYFEKDSVLYNTISSFPIQLPVDSLGRVPTGAALAEYVEQIVEVVYSPAARQFIRNLIDFGGTVTNADEIFSLPPNVLPASIELVMAAGNDYSTPTTFLIVEDASELIELFEFGPWFLEFTTNTGFPAAVIEIDGNVIELTQEVLLIDDINEQGAGATITLIQG